MCMKHCVICIDSSNSTDLLRKLDNVDEKGIQWFSKLQYIAPEIEWPSDEFICEVCMKNLEASYNFRKQCLNSLNNSKRDEDYRKHVDNTGLDELSDDEVDDNEACSSGQECSDEKVICYHCKALFSSKNILKQHLETVHDGSQETYLSKRGYEKCKRQNETHDRTMCSDDITATSHICTKCNITFKRASAFRKHEKIGCEINSKKVLFSQKLDKRDRQEEHIKKEKRSRQGKTYACDICQAQFTALKQLIGHYADAHNLEKNLVKPYGCEVCAKRFRSSTNLMTHRLYHDRSRTHTCPTCGKSFITKNDLSGHETTHRDDRNYKCDRCAKSFKTNTNLRTHCLIVHTDPSRWRFSCSVCNKKFPMKSTHDQHYRRHTGEKNFACSLCRKAFTSKSELQEHVRYHSDVRRFKCELCEKEYRKKNSLLVHRTRTHGVGDAKLPVKVKKHACHLCPGRFPDRVKLARHLCTHSGQKPFACVACEKKFTDKSYWKVHLKNIHNIIDVPVEALNKLPNS